MNKTARRLLNLSTLTTTANLAITDWLYNFAFKRINEVPQPAKINCVIKMITIIMLIGYIIKT